MQIKELKSTDLEKEFQITIPSKDINEKLNNKLLEISETSDVEGFRKGKAPIDILKQKEIFDTQKGVVRTIDVEDLGYEEIKVNKENIKCNKFIFNASSNPKDKGPFPEYTLWYDENNELMKFQFKDKGRGKKTITIIRSN